MRPSEPENRHKGFRADETDARVHFRSFEQSNIDRFVGFHPIGQMPDMA